MRKYVRYQRRPLSTSSETPKKAAEAEVVVKRPTARKPNYEKIAMALHRQRMREGIETETRRVGNRTEVVFKKA